MTGKRRFSGWGANRNATLASLTVATSCFALGVMMGFAWHVGWLLLALALGFEAVQSLRDLRERYYLFDVPLFALGMLLFTVFDPLFAIFAGTDFPGVEDTFHQGNLTGNMAGLVVSAFCLSFYIGRIFVPTSRVQWTRVVDSHSRLKITRVPILMLATGISLYAFLANGGGFGIDNLIWTIFGRTRGFVAFSTSGLGTENPLVALFGQCIPAAIVLWIVSMTPDRHVWNGLAAGASLGLFALYTLIGGRSGVILVLLTLQLYYIVRQHRQLRLGRLLLLGTVALLVLAFQANYRDSGVIEEGFFKHSPFRGFALNREIAFIVDTYGERVRYIRGPGVLPRIILPIPDTVAVFITNPIPRKFWPGKPIDPSFGPFNELRTGHTGFGASSNITPTIPGRFYISYGLWGVVQIGLVFGLLWRWFDRLIVTSVPLKSNRVLVWAMLNAIMFISLRDFTFGKFYPLLFLILFLFLGRLRFRKKSGTPGFQSTAHPAWISRESGGETLR